MTETANVTRPHRDRLVRWYDYLKACEAENLEPHSFHMWTVHGMPEGPLG